MASAGVATRVMGMTETNWCTLLDGGTGMAVSGLLFARPLSKSSVQVAVNELVEEWPYLNTQIRAGEKNKLYFELSRPVVRPEVLDVANPYLNEKEGDAEEAKETWLRIVDLEVNTMFPSARKDAPAPIIQIKLYKGLPNNSVLVVLKFAVPGLDMTSTGEIVPSFLKCLQRVVEREDQGQGIDELMQNVTLKDESLAKFIYHPCIEDGIPKGAGAKPLWASGIDVIGYGLASKKQCYLPFLETKSELKSRQVRASLSVEATDRLIQACKKNSTDLFGAMCAAVLKSVADYKRVGKKGEYYGVAIMFNCRSQLSPALPSNTLGFLTSAMVADFKVAENVKGSKPFWNVAAEITKEFQDAVKHNKQFRDIKELNLLVMQAIKHPGWTPSGSGRTAVLTIEHDPIVQTLPQETLDYLQVKDQISAISNHGVGTCVATSMHIINGALNFTATYPSPLHSRDQIQTVIDSAVKYLIASS